MLKKILLTFGAFITIIYSYSQEFSLIHDGITRTYRLHVPVGYNADSLYPLVINMHGLGSNAFEQEIYTAFNDVADSAGIVVAYPNGIDETWNISSTTGTDDVGFISALIDTLDSQYSIDLNCVYVTGMSMGGFMSYRLACELSDRIAAIASVAGLQVFYPCNPGRPVPVLQFHGTADPVVPYTGVPATISHWVNHNLCPATPVTTDLPDIDTSDNSTVTVSYYGLCEESTEVILYTINNGEHTWPGAAIIIGITNQDIKASKEIWNFFKKYNLQGSTGVENDQSEAVLSCIFYPNPVDNLAVVEFVQKPTDHFDFRIFDITGKLVLQLSNLSDQRFLIDCSRIPPGIYIAAVSSGEKHYHQKIIIR
jgi:polyhydroxybutyrate depolymerase